jgi:uncharacterized protein YwqG
MTKDEFENKIKKSAIVFQVGGFRPIENLTASWIGNITVKGINESWPEFNGQPMIPICQLNLSELTNRPDNLKDIELITLFLDSNELPDDQPNGKGWLLRTYKDLAGLEEIEKPTTNFPIKAFQLKPKFIDNDFPCQEDCPVEVPDKFDDSYSDFFPNQEGIKIGGWPTLVQSEIFWAPFNQHPAEPEFVLQIDSIEKANWYWSDNGVAYIGRGTKSESKEEWTFSWQCY